MISSVGREDCDYSEIAGSDDSLLLMPPVELFEIASLNAWICDRSVVNFLSDEDFSMRRTLTVGCDQAGWVSEGNSRRAEIVPVTRQDLGHSWPMGSEPRCEVNSKAKMTRCGG